jgi:hypothetical protein
LRSQSKPTETVDVRHFTNHSIKIQSNQDVTVDFGNDVRHGVLPKTIEIDREGAAGTLEASMHFEGHIQGRGRRLAKRPMIVLRPPPGIGDATSSGLVPQRFQGVLHPGKVLGSDQQVYVTPGADGTAIPSRRERRWAT